MLHLQIQVAIIQGVLDQVLYTVYRLVKACFAHILHCLSLI
ncbi:hypothetical protein ULG90_15175 [Halopseudomonas pachastrellae]|nr:hypothetical protein ULG90_15175 [Halopseudomonas pachastrellae]